MIKPTSMFGTVSFTFDDGYNQLNFISLSMNKTLGIYSREFFYVEGALPPCRVL